MPKTPRTIVGSPTVTLTHETDLDYARSANSRVLPDWAQRTIASLAAGEEVLAWDADRALIQALSACSHRDGQSMVRRGRARMVRHLLYKTEAILENHLEGLPPYEGGPRSPRIAELEKALEREQAQHTSTIENLVATDAAWHSLAEAARETSDRLNYALSLVDSETRARVEGYTDGIRDAAARKR